MVERWRPVVGFEDAYEVSDLGNVRSVERTVIRRNGRPHRVRSKVRAAKTTQKGYRNVTLIRDAKSTSHMVHKLVALAFIGPKPSPDHMIRHLNGVPADNRAGNLAWGTASENQLDALLHGTHHQAAKTHCPRGHPLSGVNLRVRHGRRICIACMREHDEAHRNGRPFDPDRADARYADVLAGRRRHKSERRF